MTKSVVIAIVLIISSIQVHGNDNEHKRPNVLFIAVDDLKPVLGCYGDTLIKTPNIDKLAQRGTVFLHNYCQQAVCAPSRASLMTGKRPDYTKVWDLKTQIRDMVPDILTLPQYLITKGYQTSGIGKIFDYRSVDKGQDKASWSKPYIFVENKYYYKNQLPALHYYQLDETRNKGDEYLALAKKMNMNGSDAVIYAQKFVKPSVECADVPDNAYFDGAMESKAEEVLADLAQNDVPFFFAVGFQRPHLPFVAPKKYWDLYDREEMPVATFQEHAKDSPEYAYHISGELRSYTDIPPLASFTDIKGNHLGLQLDKQKELIHGYYAAVSYVDAQIGRLLGALDSLGLAEETIIVLWGDHGWHLGDHDLWCKHSNFENATHSPLLISAHWMEANRTTSVSEFIDIFPTVCELIGVQIPEKSDGKSLVPIMKNEDASVKEFAVSQFPRGNNRMGYSIRTEQYRLTYWMKNNFRSDQEFSPKLIESKELYDYKNDPLETVNVVNSKRYKEILAELEVGMLEWFRDEEIKTQLTR